MKKTAEQPSEYPDYLSYLMRLWRVGEDGESQRTEAAWRASLESAQTGAIVSFADLEDLFFFLREQTGLTAELKEKEGRDGYEHATTVIVVIHHTEQ